MKLKFRIKDGIFKTDIMDIKQNRVNFFKYSDYKKNKQNISKDIINIVKNQIIYIFIKLDLMYKNYFVINF